MKIPSGAFKMGGEDGDDDEQPVHEVKLDGFLISKYEVTQAVWQKVMRNNLSTFEGDDNPVENVLWDDCQEFCEKTGLCLPTEAEWEYACRAGTETKYYWGDEPDGDYMWYDKNSENTTHPVGQKKPNGFGLYDMIGNVWEWCGDWFARDFYETGPAAAGRARNNPTGPGEGEGRVVRGGAWFSSSDYCYSWHRDFGFASSSDYYGGFRCVASR